MDPETGGFFGTDFLARHVFFRSTATRDAGALVGLTQAVITQDVSVGPIHRDNVFPAISCY
jgi:hypothetical protein